MELSVTKVSFQEMKHRMTMDKMMKIRLLKNIEKLVLNPSWTTDVSELILLRISPVLFSSKNEMSLLIKKKNKSYLRYWAIFSLRVLKVAPLMKTHIPEANTRTSIPKQYSSIFYHSLFSIASMTTPIRAGTAKFAPVPPINVTVPMTQLQIYAYE